MSKSDLRKKAEVALNTMTKLRRDEEVSLTILSKICKTLNADFGDIVEYVPDAEIWDLYNENRELFGKDHVRGEQLPIDGYHLMVHVWIRNSKGQYLISQRSANRPTYPLMWECVGGSVVKGEGSLLGAIREAKEEVGVDLMPENGQVLFTKTRKIIGGKIFNDIMDVWLFEYDGEVDLGNAMKYVAEKDRKPFCADLKTIYQVPTVEKALEALERVTEKWSEKYPNSMKSWKQNWDAISPIFKFSTAVRKVIYTTNAIESLNATYRKLNRQRSVFPSDTALLKALYLPTFEATKKWTMPIRNWGQIYGELSIMYEGRLPE